MQERVKSDRELTENGAQYVEDNGALKPRLEVTAEQVAEAHEEMNKDFDMNSLAERMKELAIRAANAEAEAAEASRKAADIRRMIADHQMRRGEPGVDGDQVFSVPDYKGPKIEIDQ